MKSYLHDVEVFAHGKRHTASAELWAKQDRRAIPGGGFVDGLWSWGGSITMESDDAAYEVYDDDAGRKLRFPNGEERTFVVSTFSNPLIINGNGTVPFD